MSSKVKKFFIANPIQFFSKDVISSWQTAVIRRQLFVYRRNPFASTMKPCRRSLNRISPQNLIPFLFHAKRWALVMSNSWARLAPFSAGKRHSLASCSALSSAQLSVSASLQQAVNIGQVASLTALISQRQPPLGSLEHPRCGITSSTADPHSLSHFNSWIVTIQPLVRSFS